MNIKHYLYTLVFKHCDLFALICFARTSQKNYKLVNEFLEFNKRWRQITIPKKLMSYNSIIHYLCEEFVCKKCFKCGSSFNLFYYKYNWNLLICPMCFPVPNNINNKINSNDVINERNIQGFTKCELRQRLFYRLGETHPFSRLYYRRDIEQITKNRYGFKNFTDYENFIRKRINTKNMKTIEINNKKVGVDNIFLHHMKYKKSNSHYIYEITDKEAKIISDKIIRAQVRYDLCFSILEHNKKIYDEIVEKVDDEDKVRIFLKYNFKFRCVFEIKSILFIEDLTYEAFFSDRVFKYFRRHNIPVNKVVKKIISY